MWEKIKELFWKFIALFDLFKRKESCWFVYGESLPAPYTPEEEREAMTRLAAGEEKVKNEIVEHNLRLVVYIAKKFEGKSEEFKAILKKVAETTQNAETKAQAQAISERL